MIYNYFGNRPNMILDLSDFFFETNRNSLNPGLSILIDEPNTESTQTRSREFLREIKQNLGGRIYQRVISDQQRVSKSLSFYNDNDSENVVKLSMFEGAPCLGGGSWEVGDEIGDEYYTGSPNSYITVGTVPTPLNGIKRYREWRKIKGSVLAEPPQILVTDEDGYSSDRCLKSGDNISSSVLLTDIAEADDYFAIQYKVKGNGYAGIYLWSDASFLMYLLADPTLNQVDWFIVDGGHTMVGGVLNPTAWNTIELRRIIIVPGQYRYRLWINGILRSTKVKAAGPCLAPITKVGIIIKNYTAPPGPGLNYLDQIAMTYIQRGDETPSYSWWETYGDLINLVREVGVNHKPFWDCTGREFEIIGLSSSGVMVKNRNFSNNFKGHEHLWFRWGSLSASLVFKEIEVTWDSSWLFYNLPDIPIAVIDFAGGSGPWSLSHFGFNPGLAPDNYYIYQDENVIRLNKTLPVFVSYVRIQYIALEVAINSDNCLYGRKIIDATAVDEEKELLTLDNPLFEEPSYLIESFPVMYLGYSDGVRLVWKFPYDGYYTFDSIVQLSEEGFGIIPSIEYTIDFLNKTITFLAPRPVGRLLIAELEITSLNGEFETTVIEKAGIAKLVRITDGELQFNFHTDNKYEVSLQIQEVKPKEYENLYGDEDYQRP